MLRLEHEFTPLATREVLGEMCMNLLDELIADCMGMPAALGPFSAEVFERCMQERWLTYVGDLDPRDAQQAMGHGPDPASNQLGGEDFARFTTSTGGSPSLTAALALPAAAGSADPGRWREPPHRLRVA